MTSPAAVTALYHQAEPGRDWTAMGQKISDLINARDLEGLRGWTMHGRGFNDSTKAVVFQLIGQKLPGNRQAIGEALDRWAGLTPADRARIEAEKQAKLHAITAAKVQAEQTRIAQARLARVGSKVIAFTQGRSPLETGRLDKILSKPVAKQTGGKLYTGPASEVVAQLAQAGFRPATATVDAVAPVSRTRYNRMDGRQQADYERRKADAGQKTEYRLVSPTGTFFIVTKAEHDFAAWLQTPPTAPITQSSSPSCQTPPVALTQ